MKKFVVETKATCTMLVIVQASDEKEAKRLARKGEYEPWTEWEESSGYRVTKVLREIAETDIYGMSVEYEAST